MITEVAAIVRNHHGQCGNRGESSSVLPLSEYSITDVRHCKKLIKGVAVIGGKSSQTLPGPQEIIPSFAAIERFWVKWFNSNPYFCENLLGIKPIPPVRKSETLTTRLATHLNLYFIECVLRT